MNTEQIPILYYSFKDKHCKKYNLHLTYSNNILGIDVDMDVENIQIDGIKRICYFLLKNNKIIRFNVNTRFLQYKGCDTTSYIYQYPIELQKQFFF
jgi:hypothetical protein